MSLNELEHDERGNVVENPVTAWSVTTLEGETVLLTFEHSALPSELKTANDGNKIQLELTLTQALQLAASLAGVAKHMLSSHPL